MNATEILNYLAFSDFEQAIEITREFDSLPKRPGVYAVRHRIQGVLYIGKTNNLATRFNRHSALQKKDKRISSYRGRVLEWKDWKPCEQPGRV
ncbi:MAG: GIY-YIG nuclease family protein [Symploca sp. SIO1B1]|nr:GIY-YIG nuclease family protein [Symploca sp. SIO2D2]NER47299.1 GIY-YIG nuclease family protein [Symploca sp. SIO1A3]NER99068.1 GIY-YIG nuclease family protein [Symploca sp. SIO1B1]